MQACKRCYEVFIAQGYRRTQMADIAEALGVAKGRDDRCRMNLEDEDTLLLRGYIEIPLIGRTTKWFSR